MKERLRILLKLLLQMEAERIAVAQNTMIAAMVTAFAGAVTRADAERVITDAELKGLISGNEHDVFGIQWMLTSKGQIAAQQLH